MTLEEFNEYLDTTRYKTEYIVHIRQKYDHEKEYMEFNTLLLLSEDGTMYIWEDDWNEGQQDIQILWFVAIDDVKPLQNQWIPCNHKLQTTGIPIYCPNCGCKMDMRGEEDVRKSY